MIPPKRTIINISLHKNCDFFRNFRENLREKQTVWCIITFLLPIWSADRRPDGRRKTQWQNGARYAMMGTNPEKETRPCLKTERSRSSARTENRCSATCCSPMTVRTTAARTLCSRPAKARSSGCSPQPLRHARRWPACPARARKRAGIRHHQALLRGAQGKARRAGRGDRRTGG